MQKLKSILKNHPRKRKFFLFLAVALALTIILFRHEFGALAQSVIDSFTDSSKVADTWNVTVDTGSGEVKLSERSCDNDVWFCDEADVCSDTLGDGDYIIVKRTNESSTKQWKTEQTACDQPECGTDGVQSGDNLVADNTVNFLNYPARDACAAAGGRLPTIAELQCIYTNRATFGDNFGTGNFWSAAEYSTAAGAWYVNFSAGGASSLNKTTSGYVRCVRGW